MSNAVFPTSNLPGLSWSVIQTPQFNTGIQRSVSGRELRTSYMRYPLWTIQLTYDLLRDGNAYGELQTIMGFFLDRQGSFDSFFYSNPNDNTASSVILGLGDGANTNFQLSRNIGAGGFVFNEPVNNVVVSNISANGAVQSNYTVSNTGMVTFNSAPSANAVITWNGTYYYKVRFTDDSADFDNFMHGLWQLKKLSFVGSVVNKV